MFEGLRGLETCDVFCWSNDDSSSQTEPIFHINAKGSVYIQVYTEHPYRGKPFHY